MSEATPVDRLFDETRAIVEKLIETDPSLAVAAAENLRKSLLMAAASHFENRLCDCVQQFVSDLTGGHGRIVSFVRNKAIARQYHTWFSWEEINANHFFGLFGEEFKKLMKNKSDADESLKQSIRAFLEIGRDRNRLAHQDYATFPLEKTAEEIYALFQLGLDFVEQFPRHLRDASASED